MSAGMREWSDLGAEFAVEPRDPERCFAAHFHDVAAEARAQRGDHRRDGCGVRASDQLSESTGGERRPPFQRLIRHPRPPADGRD